MSKIVVALLCFTILLGCKDDKKKSSNAAITVEDFFNEYNKLKLPFTVNDSTMRKLPDTATIDYAEFKQFIPDTVFNNPFGTERKFVLHPIGKIEKDKETYLTTYVTSKGHSAIYLSVFNNKKFSVSMPLIVSNTDDVNDAASIDKKLSIVISKEWTDKDDLLYNRIIYAYNNVGMFTTILTETNEERSNVEAAILNPLDTFPKKNKYSGDYLKGKKNLLSLRDGKTPTQYMFFIHFQNEGDEETEACGGELKGQLNMVSEKTGVFSQVGDPCMIDFTFAGNEIKIKENNSCGNHRGIKCFFNDTYTRKKETKQGAKGSTKKNNAKKAVSL
jgi:hypothetical protein